MNKKLKKGVSKINVCKSIQEVFIFPICNISLFISVFKKFLFSYSCLFPIAHYHVASPLPQSTPTLSMPMSPLFLFIFLPLPLLSPVTLSSHSSDHCQFILYFQSLLLFCSFISFVDQIPLIYNIIQYLSFTAWLI